MGKIMIPLLSFEQSFLFNDNLNQLKEESISILIDTARNELSKQSGVILYQELLKSDKVLTVQSEEALELTGDGTKSIMFLRTMVSELVDKPIGFFKCPACKQIINLSKKG